MQTQLRPLILAVSIAAAFAAPLASAENVRVAFIETLSGPFAPIGQNQLRSYQTFTETAKEKNGPVNMLLNSWDSTTREVRRNR